MYLQSDGEDCCQLVFGGTLVRITLTGPTVARATVARRPWIQISQSESARKKDRFRLTGEYEELPVARDGLLAVCPQRPQRVANDGE